MFDVNPIIATDSYKVSHYKQYPKGTQHVFSYLEPRKGGAYPEVVAFDARQYYFREALRPVTWDDIAEAKEVFTAHFGNPELFNEAGWKHIMYKHEGRLPLRIRAVPEGTRVPIDNVLMTVENTDPAVPWLTNYAETRLMQMWYPITVATLSADCRQRILAYLQRTGTPELIDFKLHDFGYRGVSSQESAAIGGLAHLVNFMGSDTLAAIMFGRKYYKCPAAGFSIPAAEHSTITSWGRLREVDAYRNMLTAYPEGLVAVVSDSYNIYDACDFLWGEVLRDEVLVRKGTLVIRPDSGNPVEVVPKVLDILGARFGYTLNQNHYRVLPEQVRVIQGDGVNPESISEILKTIARAGWSADNIAFGMGGALLQQVNRDTCRFAFKCSSITIDGVEQDVYKSVATDPTKASKRGRITLYKECNGFGFTTDRRFANVGPDYRDAFEEVFLNGETLVSDSLDTIRKRAYFGYNPFAV